MATSCPSDGEQLGQLHLARMPRGIGVQPAGIPVEQRADIGRLCRIIARDGRLRAEQMEDVIGLCAIPASDRAQPAARHRQHVLQRREIVLAMRITHAVGDIGVGPPKDMGHSPKWSRADHRVVMVRRGAGVAVGGDGVPRRQGRSGSAAATCPARLKPYAASASPVIPALRRDPWSRAYCRHRSCGGVVPGASRYPFPRAGGGPEAASGGWR